MVKIVSYNINTNFYRNVEKRFSFIYDYCSYFIHDTDVPDLINLNVAIREAGDLGSGDHLPYSFVYGFVL